MSLRFSKNQRLSQSSEIRKVFASKQKLYGKGFLIKWTSGGLTSRLCVSVRKKEIPTAVARNRARRLVKEFFRKHAHEFKKPVDLVIQVLSQESWQYQDLEKLLTRELKDSGVM